MPIVDNIVEVFIPEAEIFEVNCDEESFSKLYKETGVFNSVSFEDQRKAYAKSQENMRDAVQNNSVLLSQAKERAKILIEQYILHIGQEQGKVYTIKWIKNAEEPVAE